MTYDIKLRFAQSECEKCCATLTREYDPFKDRFMSVHPDNLCVDSGSKVYEQEVEWEARRAQ